MTNANRDEVDLDEQKQSQSLGGIRRASEDSSDHATENGLVTILKMIGLDRFRSHCFRVSMDIGYGNFVTMDSAAKSNDVTQFVLVRANRLCQTFIIWVSHTASFDEGKVLARVDEVFATTTDQYCELLEDWPSMAGRAVLRRLNRL